MMRLVFPFLLLLIISIALPDCESSNISLDGDVTDGNEEPGDSDAIDGDDELDVDEPNFTVTTHVLNVEEAQNSIATGDFGTPALSLEPIAVDPKYTHVLNFMVSPMMPPLMEPIPTHGPLILYSDNFETLVVSPLDEFFTAYVHFVDGALVLGVNGEVNELPAGFSTTFAVVEGQGIAATIEKWGRVLRGIDRPEAGYAMPQRDRYADPGLSYLGYWTDNGAYYYYNTEPEMNEQNSLLAIKAEFDEKAIPVGYFQLDSWWYFKAAGTGFGPGGLLRWEPQPEMFPDGLAAFQQTLGLPLILHNRWFAKDNDYVNDYNFVSDTEMSMPTGCGVFDHFMDDAQSWGVCTYEQDWLVSQYWGSQWLREAPGRGHDWISCMHDAAQARDMTMQLCMTGAAHLMDAATRPVATTVRTSIDYSAGISKESFWPQFHTVNMIAWAVGLLPFKDNFQSIEAHGEAEALISSLSAGMVGPGDGLGRSQRDILMRTCRDDGLLLKPDRPAMPIEAMFLPHARPYTVHTWNDREDLGRWHYVAAFLLAEEHPGRTSEDRIFESIAYDGMKVNRMFNYPAEVTDWQVNTDKDIGVSANSVLYNWRTGEAERLTDTFSIPEIAEHYGFAYFVIAPILSNGMALIGEAAKFITLANRRFDTIEAKEDGIFIRISGAPGEQVSLLGYNSENDRLTAPLVLTVAENGAAEGTLPRPH